MNVLVCIPCLMTGGTEIQTLNLVKALITAEHKVTTVCYFEHSTNMVERYKQAGSNVCLLSPDGKRPVGITNTVILLYKGLHRVLREVKPDVVHVQYMAPGAIPIIILRLLGIKRIGSDGSYGCRHLSFFAIITLRFAIYTYSISMYYRTSREFVLRKFANV